MRFPYGQGFNFSIAATSVVIEACSAVQKWDRYVEMGQQHRFERAPATSAIPPIATELLRRNEGSGSTTIVICASVLECIGSIFLPSQ
jgi:hypothetical protein